MNIYLHPFEGTNVVTKVNKKFDEITLQELVVSFCILNSFLEENPSAPLVPTYGFFLCGKNENKDNCISEKNYPMDGIPHIFIVQKYIDAITFYDWIKNGALLSQIKKIIFMVNIISIMVIYKVKIY